MSKIYMYITPAKLYHRKKYTKKKQSGREREREKEKSVKKTRTICICLGIQRINA